VTHRVQVCIQVYGCNKTSAAATEENQSCLNQRADRFCAADFIGQTVAEGQLCEMRLGLIEKALRAGALYQGTTLVGPFRCNNDLGFSPCAPLAIPGWFCAIGGGHCCVANSREREGEKGQHLEKDSPSS
jgi:hypothetical protein